MWKSADIRFFWNRYIQNYFIKRQLNDWILPIMKGFIQVNFYFYIVKYIFLNRLEIVIFIMISWN